MKPDAQTGMKMDLRRSLKMHRRAAIWVFAITTVALVALAMTRKPQYMAQSLIYIQPGTPKPLTDVTPGFYDSSRYDSYMQQQLQTITRDDILADALKQIPAGMWQQQGESEEAAIMRLRSSLKVERLLSSYEVQISLKGGDPVSVTRVVNEVTSAFLKSGRRDETAQSDQQLQLLVQERARISAALAKDREEQAGLSSSLGVADTARRLGESVYGHARLANQVSSMPSVHFLWAMLIAAAVVSVGRTWRRWLVVAHPLMTLAAIVLTGNHYWLDAVAAGLLGLVAIRATDRLRRTRA